MADDGCYVEGAEDVDVEGRGELPHSVAVAQHPSRVRAVQINRALEGEELARDDFHNVAMFRRLEELVFIHHYPSSLARACSLERSPAVYQLKIEDLRGVSCILERLDHG